MNLHRYTCWMRIFTGVCKKLGSNEPNVKCVTRIDVALARIVDCQVQLSFRVYRADHLGNFLQEIAEIYSNAVDGQRQQLVEFRRDLNARAKIVKQQANLLRRRAFAALGNGVALKANNAAQAG